ncbi:PAS domain S-box protein [Planctomycetaceae bacterium SH139]
MNEKRSRKSPETEIQSGSAAHDGASSGCDPSASGFELASSLDDGNSQGASTEIFSNSAAGLADHLRENTGPSPTVEKSSAIDQLLHGHDKTLDQQKIPSAVRLEKYHPFNARYMIGEEIGNGGMGLVYRGWDLQLQRNVAIKIVRREHHGNEKHLIRFLREARIASQLSHPGILGIHDFGTEPAGSAYMITDLITGKTMEQAIADTIVDGSKRESMLTTFFQICQAIAFAHANRVVHRDLKPANIIVGDYGIATVLDWGLAKVLTTSELRSKNVCEESLRPLPLENTDESFEHPKSDLDTVFGTIMGTPNFLAPEQARGEAVDYRADVFALGGILCNLLTGSPPFVGDTLFKVYKKSVAGDLSYAFDQLDRCGAPIPLIQLVKRCLAADVSSRPKDASFLVDNLQAYLESGQRRAEEELVRFFDLSLDLFCIATTKGYFWRLNDNFSRVLGYSNKELTAKPFIEFVHPDDQPETLNEIKRLSRGEPTIQFINRYRLKDGQYIYLEWTARSVEDEGVIYAVARDVSGRIRLEEEKLRAEADCFRLSEIVDSAGDAIVGKNLDGVIQSWNYGAERLFGYTSDEMVGQSITKLLPADRLEEEATILKLLCKGRRVENIETVRIHKSGAPIDVSVNVSPIRDASGKITGASKIARDILIQKKLESELQKSRRELVGFAEDANMPLHHVDQTGTIVWANDAELKLLGYTRQEYVGQPIAKFHANRATIGDVSNQLIQGNSLSHYRAQLIAKEGSIKDVAIYASAFQENGKLIYTRCITIDLTPFAC